MRADPLVTEADVKAVADQMRSQWIGRGDAVSLLEKAMAHRVNVPHAVALGSGTAALIVALRMMKAGGLSFPPDSCEAIKMAAAQCKYEYGPTVKLAIYPNTDGHIVDYARHMPRRGETVLRARFGIFSFGALKDVSGGLGGCIVSREPIDAEDFRKISPLSDINAAMILSQLARYQGKADYRLVADNKLWKLKEAVEHHPV